MLRRPSASTDEDEPESHVNAKAPSTRESKKGQFSSAKIDASQNSDTLDRRKAEKPSNPNQLNPPQWTTTKNAVPSSKKQEKGSKKAEGRTSTQESADAMDITQWRRPRLKSPWKTSLLTLATTAFSIVLLFAIVNSFFTRHLDPKGCKNCLMRPIFGKFEGFDTEHTRFASKYSLHLYREGGVNEDMTAS